MEYQTELGADHRSGNQLFEENRFADAVVSYRKAVEQEQRRWMRRVILARMVHCYHNMNRIVQAGETFRLILQSDPTTQLLHAMPLDWVSASPPSGVVERARRWIAEEAFPAMRLMGASWLLAGPHRKQAIKTLDSLSKVSESKTSDPRIAKLAQAQLWRDQIVTAPVETIAQWKQTVTTLPPNLRAGPYFLLGKLQARHQRHQEAVLALMRVPILYPAQQDVVAESLFAAGEQLNKLGNKKGATAVYKELVTKHPNHRLTPLAQQRLP